MSESEQQQQLQIRLLTESCSLSVPSTTLSVPAKIGPDGLNSLLKKLLEENLEDDDLSDKTFEFVAVNDLIRGPLSEFLSGKESLLSSESVLEILYFESRPAPKPENSFSHSDWVSGVSVRGDFVLTACYDNTLNLFNVKTGEKKLTIPGNK